MLSPAVSRPPPVTAALPRHPLLPSSSFFPAITRSSFLLSSVFLHTAAAAARSLSPLRSCGKKAPPLLPRAAMAAPSVTADAYRKGGQGLLVFPTEEELAVSLAKYTAELSQKFVAERGAFTVVLSGESLIIKSIRKLAEAPYLESVDWSKWHVFWVDERVTRKDHKDSNYRLAYDGFLSKVPIPPGQVYSINDALSAEGAAEDYERCLKRLVNIGVIAASTATGFPKFDLILLGMGPDGHIASLFRGHPLLYEKERWVTFIKNSPKPPPERITFTIPVINSSSYIAMVVTGSGKAGAVAKALGSKRSSDLLPVEMVKIEAGKFTWFTDKDAVSMLEDLENP